VLLHLDGGAESLPAHGDPVLLGDREIGWVASAARHYELGPLATAVIKRSVDPAADLVVRASSGEIAAGQEVVVLVR
jgi:folate-binding Fe-S cluster repair protein YgfZ